MKNVMIIGVTVKSTFDQTQSNCANEQDAVLAAMIIQSHAIQAHDVRFS